MINKTAAKRPRRKSKKATDMSQNERLLLRRIRFFLRVSGLKVKPDRLASLFVVAFRQEFPQAHLANAYVRGLPAYRRLLQDERGSLSQDETAKLLNVPVKELKRRYHEGQIIGFTDQPRTVRFPVWQFRDGGPLPGLEEVLSVLNAEDYMDDTGRMLFFLSTFASVGKRPLDFLRAGDIPGAVRLAQGYVQL